MVPAMTCISPGRTPPDAMNGPLFSVTALDADGAAVVSTIVGEDGMPFSYSQFVADAGQGPYEDGFVCLKRLTGTMPG